MATIKSYTNLQQSKKLAEILTLESADMIYIMYSNGEKPQNGDENLSTVYESNEHQWYWIDIIDESWDIRNKVDIPCWSLAALLDILDYPSLTQNKENEWEVCVLNCESDGYIEVSAGNPVDACYKMVLKLHEKL